MAFTDSALAPLLEAVRASSPAPLLVVTADHGEARGDHGEMTHSLFAYEATLHVPLFLWCPDRLVAAGRDDTPARHVDIVPTVLDAARRRRRPESARAVPAARPRREEAPEAPTSRLSRPRSIAAGRRCGASSTAGMKYIDLPVPELYDLSDRSR